MATRSGTVDPGLVLWLLEHAGLTGNQVAEALEHESGLLALGGDADMQALLDQFDRGDERATLAIDVYVHRLVAGIAAMAAALDGMDVLAFTGGVGENAPAIRAMTAARLGFLGVRVDGERNLSARGDVLISASDASVQTVVVTAREDLEIARGVEEVLQPD
jgi:acetate kinase